MGRAAAATAPVRHVGVSDQVLPVDRHQRAARDPGGESGGRLVLRVGEAVRAVGEPLVLDPDRLLVRPPVAGVPGDVGEVDELHDPAAARDDVVRRCMCARALQPAHRAPEGALRDVDDDLVDRLRAPVRLREVALALQPDERRPGARSCVRDRDDETRDRDRRGQDTDPPETHRALSLARGREVDAAFTLLLHC